MCFILKQHGQLKSNHDRLLDEIERFNQQLKQEQQRNIALKTELKNASQNSREILEVCINFENFYYDLGVKMIFFWPILASAKN